MSVIEAEVRRPNKAAGSGGTATAAVCAVSVWLAMTTVLPLLHLSFRHDKAKRSHRLFFFFFPFFFSLG